MSTEAEKTLLLEKFVGGGYSRRCFEHPLDSAKCVKVSAEGKEDADPLMEFRVAALVSPLLPGFVVDFYPVTIDTNCGEGIVCELVRDDDGTVSKSLRSYKDTGRIDGEIVSEINEFTRLLISKDIFFYDFNYGNFVIKKEAGRKKLLMVDLKSFNNSGCDSFLDLEYKLAPLARNVMFRRIRRILYTELGIEFPWGDLCKKRRFWPLLVKVKLDC